MPAHFTHIYMARRIADYLAGGEVPDWPSAPDIPADPTQVIFTDTIGKYGPVFCGTVMRRWEKFTAIGAIGPDLFYFSQDFSSKTLGVAVPPSDEIMLSLAVYFFDKTLHEQDYEPLLIILDKVDSTLGALVRFLIKLAKLWNEFLAVWASTVGPLVHAVDTALDDLTGGLLTSLGDGISALKTGLITFVEEELLTAKDIFAALDTCVEKGWDDQSLLWGDVLHYRRTTEIGRRLIEQAESMRSVSNDQFEQMLAFALGWITHVGTDTIGHSFVNEQCGGPFRNHPQRHHLIENHIDAWNYRQADAAHPGPPDPIAANATYPDLTLSGLAFAVHLDPTHPHGVHRPATLPNDPVAAAKALTVDGAMPGWMADAIVKALIATYGDDPHRPADHPTHPLVYQGDLFQQTIDGNLLTQTILDITGHGPNAPLPQLLADIAPTPGFPVPVGFPLPWQVQVCYRLMLTFYQLSYVGGWDLDKPRKPSVVTLPPSSDFTNLLNPPDFSGPSTGDPIEDLCNVVKALIDWVTKELDAALTLIGDLIKMLASPGTYFLRLGLYKLAMLVWDSTQKIHEVLAHTGFFVPHGEQLYPGPDHELRQGNEIDEQLITLGGSADAAFQQALADALDPFANLDHTTGQGIPGHPIPDDRYPLYMVIDYKDAGATAPKHDSGGAPVTKEFRRPWAYPSLAFHDDTLVPAPTEQWLYTPPAVPPGAATPDPPGPALAGPYPAGSRPDSTFFRTDRPTDPQARHQYENSRHPQDTDALNARHLFQSDQAPSPLGDPIPFSAYLIGALLNDREYDTQFNLDADRAYAYLTWDWIRDHTRTVPADLPGVRFEPPVVAPQLSKDWTGPAAVLQSRYLDLRPDVRIPAEPTPDATPQLVQDHPVTHP